METVNNIKSAATRAIWGDKTDNDTQSGLEPMSGVTGNTDAGEPYDAGNLGESTESTTNGQAEERNTAQTKPIHPEHETDKTGVTSGKEPTPGVSDNKPTNSNDTSGPSPESSVGAHPSKTPQDTQRQKGEDPSGGDSQRIKETKAEAGEARNVKLDGPGPQTLEEKAKNGGVARASKSERDDDGPQKESHGESTGERYIKSRGVEADGGDSDAAKPGAGKEANRFLEKQDVHHTTAPTESKDNSAESSATPNGGKPSLKEKIKAKLHRN